MFKINLCTTLYITTAICVQSSFGDEEKPSPTPFQDWDYLVYSQRWPVTTCTEWKEESKKNICNLPKNKNIWTVHGIWPTKVGADGPFFCNSALHFDINQLVPIENDLNTYWINVENNTKPFSFWKHEWDKHGTCAAVLPTFNSVANYFQQGLSWNKQFDLNQILLHEKIVPNKLGYKIEEIYESVKNVIKKNPTIQCVVNSKESLLSEIRICFDKNLQVIDCDVIHPDGAKSSVLTNCNLKKPVMYYGYENVTNDADLVFESTFNDDYYNYYRSFLHDWLENYKYREGLLGFYKIVKFLIWFTL